MCYKIHDVNTIKKNKKIVIIILNTIMAYEGSVANCFQWNHDKQKTNINKVKELNCPKTTQSEAVADSLWISAKTAFPSQSSHKIWRPQDRPHSYFLKSPIILLGCIFLTFYGHQHILLWHIKFSFWLCFAWAINCNGIWFMVH